MYNQEVRAQSRSRPQKGDFDSVSGPTNTPTPGYSDSTPLDVRGMI